MNMTCLYGRAPPGQRLVDALPHGHWKTSTFIGALRCDGLTATGVIDGAINGEPFLAWVEQVLVPTLRQGDVVIMDNYPMKPNPKFSVSSFV
jgi:DDE superfamily endonuclease